MLGGQALTLGLALGGDVQDGAAQVLAAAVGQRDRLGMQRQDPDGAVGSEHPVLAADGAVAHALPADPGDQRPVGGMDQLQMGDLVQRLLLLQLQQPGQAGRVA